MRLLNLKYWRVNRNLVLYVILNEAKISLHLVIAQLNIVALFVFKRRHQDLILRGHKVLVELSLLPLHDCLLDKDDLHVKLLQVETPLQEEQRHSYEYHP